MARRSQMPKSGTRKRTTKDAKRESGLPPVLLFSIVAAVIVLVVGVVLLQAQSVRAPIEVSGEAGEGSSWGPVDAKVKLTDYSDFGCSHCADFALSQGRELRQKYEASGNVRVEFRHFIIGGATTANAANASLCAADQGRFWDYHDLLFSRQGVSASPFAVPALKQYAVQLGLETSSFDTCVDNGAHLEEVYRQTSEGRGLGVNATPTFFLNGQKLEGALPLASFEAAIEAALAQ